MKERFLELHQAVLVLEGTLAVLLGHPVHDEEYIQSSVEAQELLAFIPLLCLKKLMILSGAWHRL